MTNERIRKLEKKITPVEPEFMFGNVPTIDEINEITSYCINATDTELINNLNHYKRERSTLKGLGANIPTLQELEIQSELSKRGHILME